MSSQPNRLLIVSVMPENVNCSTASHFVEFTASNLITMGVTSTNDIVLSPDWNLVVGLLLGMLGLVLILLGFMYYFCKRAWLSHNEIQSTARQHNRDGKVPKTRARAAFSPRRNLMRCMGHPLENQE
jgi:hypothetical protein